MLSKIFGIQGIDGERDFLYFDSNGKLNDALSTKQTYEALDYLSQLYAEGLIVGDFNIATASGTDTSKYLDLYFRHTREGAGYGFMLYDYSQTTTIVNDKDAKNIGTDPNMRVDEFKLVNHQGFREVLSPLTYWVTEAYDYNDYDVRTANILDRTYKTLVRYEESSYALKSYGLCIPVFSDNVADAIKLLDYLYSNEGIMTVNFGPKTYWKNGKIDSFELLDSLDFFE